MIQVLGIRWGGTGDGPFSTAWDPDFLIFTRPFFFWIFTNMFLSSVSLTTVWVTFFWLQIMSWRLLQEDELSMTALCNIPLESASLAEAKSIACKHFLCCGCIWWNNDDSIDVLYVFCTSIPVCYCARLLIHDLFLSFYAPPETLLSRGCPSGRHNPIHSSRWNCFHFIIYMHSIARRSQQAVSLLPNEMFSEAEFLEISYSVVHFYRLQSLEFLHALEFIGGYSWWRSEEGLHARAWFTQDMFVFFFLNFSVSSQRAF